MFWLGTIRGGPLYSNKKKSWARVGTLSGPCFNHHASHNLQNRPKRHLDESYAVLIPDYGNTPILGADKIMNSLTLIHHFFTLISLTHGYRIKRDSCQDLLI
jgi:hypothetical protein